ncbi:MAG: phosphotyrosine protein phosphatase [Draconibacterium sp.]|nr:MAG: phosphotyrosine protein phosphatase [Draconibacterium sp.]
MKMKRVLFVCLGNICRSPAAEAVFTEIVRQAKKQSAFEIDSAGTSGWHIGEPADSRMQYHAGKRGYQLTSISRKFNPSYDFDHFDYIIGMDNENIRSLKQLARTDADELKIHKMTDFCDNQIYTEVPDPYYGGEKGFELVLDLLEDSCKGLLKTLC